MAGWNIQQVKHVLAALPLDSMYLPREEPSTLPESSHGHVPVFPHRRSSKTRVLCPSSIVTSSRKRLICSRRKVRRFVCVFESKMHITLLISLINDQLPSNPKLMTRTGALSCSFHCPAYSAVSYASSIKSCLVYGDLWSRGNAVID